MVTSCHSDEPAPVSDTSRTVLVYMVATNNLGSNGYDEADIAEMQTAIAAGALGKGRWIVYHAPSDKSAPMLTEYSADGIKLLKSYPEGVVSVSAEQLGAVIDDVKSFAPADNYGLVMWSHATGWTQDGIDEPDRNAAPQMATPLSFGSDFGKKMNVTTLADVLEGRGFEYVYFDACYMATVEVAYQLRHAVRYVVGSPSELPVNGMRYDLNMAALIDGSENALIQAARNTYNHYNSQQLAEDRTCTMAVIRTDALDELASATAAVYDLTPLPHPGENVTNYRARSRQGYAIDFGEYVNALAESENIDNGIQSRFNTAIGKAVVYKAATEKIWDLYPVYSTSGLATYVFNNADDFDVMGYDELAWAQDVVEPHHLH